MCRDLEEIAVVCCEHVKYLPIRPAQTFADLISGVN
jgi:hypothetical protein